jgi:hypothetical protein
MTSIKVLQLTGHVIGGFFLAFRVPKLRLGTRLLETLFRVLREAFPHSGNGVSPTGVPKRSLGTRRTEHGGQLESGYCASFLFKNHAVASNNTTVCNTSA